ncbi:MAG: hypothetical protein V4686_00835 [Patescibacteria group bacterium]
MTNRFDAKKEIEDLAIMTHNNFTVVFDKFAKVDERLNKLDERLYSVENRLGALEKNSLSADKKLDLILENMVTKYEFESLKLRTEKVESVLGL